MKALVIGGTGPTGHHIVNGPIARGYTVEILHRGTHEIDEIPPEVVHHHCDPYNPAVLGEFFGARCYDLCVALTLRQRTEIIAAALGSPIEIVSMPWELAVPARQLVMQPLSTLSL